jgi:hypothetical protein
MAASAKTKKIMFAGMSGCEKKDKSRASRYVAHVLTNKPDKNPADSL